MAYSWKNVLISPQDTIRQTLILIDSESLRVALVVDEQQKLLGVVTDGDIRRGLLNDLSLDSNIELVMNRSPIIASDSLSRSAVMKLMEDNKILSVPLVDDDGIVVGLETFHGALSGPRFENPVFLMAGGFGTRLQPLTDNCPKPMLKVGGKPILETIIDSFIEAGFVNFYISTHYMPEQIVSYFGDGSSKKINIAYVHEETPLGTGGALGLLPDDLPDCPLIMMNGDVLTRVDFERLLDFHDSNSADVTMCVREYDYQIPYGVISGDGNKIVSMEEKPTQRFFVNAGVYVINQKVVKSVPKDHVVDMPSLVEQEIADGGEALMFPIYEYWLDIGRMDDLNRAQADFNALGIGK
ncbi:MAG: CBS domain-containing protein [Gammaproteobacteria bacterium]|nr:MAG: CBS domain-containing protein [Gammaproteobacteria bacterium]